MSSNEAEKRRISCRECTSEGGTVVSQDGKGAKHHYDNMKVSIHNKVFRIQLNRPHRKNALSMQMYSDLCCALREAAEDDDIQVAVITGTGDYYCSGNDIGNIASSSGDPEQLLRSVVDLVKAFIDFPKVLIALVNGPAVGIAVTLLGLCDAVYCSDRATFHTPFTQLGQNAEGCSSYTFPKIMGTVKAKEMLLFSKKITAQEAYDRNLVTQVIPDAHFQTETEAVLAYVASLPPQSLQLSKMLIRNHERELLHKVNDAESKLLQERAMSEESINAAMSFLSRKKAKL